jgi:hypothetical protein
MYEFQNMKIDIKQPNKLTISIKIYIYIYIYIK